MRFNRNRLVLILSASVIFVIILQLLNYSKLIFSIQSVSSKHFSERVFINQERIFEITTTHGISSNPSTTRQIITESYAFPNLPVDVSSSCRGNIFLYIIVVSDKYNFKQRQKIRQSWASVKIVDHKLISSVFLVTFDNKNITGHESLIEESRKYQDVFYSKFTRTDRQLLFLYSDSLKLAKACPTAQFNLVINDDMFPNIPVITNELSSNISLMCNVVPDNPVIRQTGSIYYVSKEDYPFDKYPPHCKQNSPFIMSGSLATEIADNLNETKIWFYDAYLLGILPRKFNKTVIEFPKSISIVEMRPHFAYLNRKLYGILVNGLLLPERIWKKLMLQMVLK